MLIDYCSQKLVSFDIETYDPLLERKQGGRLSPQWGEGYVLGYALACWQGSDIVKEWFVWNSTSQAYLQELFEKVPYLLGVNLIYDFTFLAAAHNMYYKGTVIDITIAEYLIYELAKSYSLETLAMKYLGEKKGGDSGIQDFCREKKWIKKNGDFRSVLYKLPDTRPDLLAAYGVSDVEQPLKIWRIQRDLLYKQRLLHLFEKESALLPLLVHLKIHGVRVKGDYIVHELIRRSNKTKRVLEDIDILLGDKRPEGFTPNSALKVGEALQALGENLTHWKRSEKTGRISIAKEELQKHTDLPLVKMLVHLKDVEKIERDTKQYMIHINKGRIHCNLRSARGLTGGTISGRFSSNNPNLQNVSKRDYTNYNSDELSNLRSLFIPEEGHLWVSIDYSQIEYRIFISEAKGRGSDAARQQFVENPDMDFHIETAKKAGLVSKYIEEHPDCDEETAASKVKRDAKGVNFGILYGQGVVSLALKNNWSQKKAREFYSMFYEKMPYIEYTKDYLRMYCAYHGHIVTIGGRHLHLEYEDKHYTLLNKLCQGSNADQLKFAMVDIYKAGLATHPDCRMLLPVHDELNFSIKKERVDEFVPQLVKYMQEAIPLNKVPVKVSYGIGANWHEAK